ncbi:hypothetical protein CEE45_12000 [Candidatus Heimdallarchaeota archaeon B3_Heim]|nr:MAG: hypothetical protein CEE45_12000 [Candidatus Heimdallarchaeota archaeon B3_Heim]
MYINKRNFDLVIKKILGTGQVRFVRIKKLSYQIAQTAFILLILGMLYAIAAILFTAPKAILGHEFASSFTQFGFSWTGITNIAVIGAFPIAIVLVYMIYRARKEVSLTYSQVLTYSLIILSITVPFMFFWRLLIGLLCLAFLVKFFYFILLPQLFLTFTSES